MSQSHDGLYLATASVDGCVKLWNCLSLPPSLISSSHPSTPDHSPLRLSWNHSHQLLACFQGLSTFYSWKVTPDGTESETSVAAPSPVVCALWLEKEGCDQFYVTACSEFVLCLYFQDECVAYLKEESHIEDVQVLPPPHRLVADTYRDVGWASPRQQIVSSHVDPTPLYSRVLLIRNTSTLQLFTIDRATPDEASPYKYQFILEDEMKLDVPIVCLGSNFSTVSGGTSDASLSYMTLLTLFGGDILSIVIKVLLLFGSELAYLNCVGK